MSSKNTTNRKEIVIMADNNTAEIGFEKQIWDADEYTSEGIFFVPAGARWSEIAAKAHTPEIGTKLDTNFVDVVIQKQRLRISVNMKFADIYDPNGICRDITNLGRWGNGDVELYMEHTSDIDQVMEIIEQSYKAQADE